MHILDIKSVDFNNGDGANVSIWVAGCPHHCKGCHNQESWDYNAGHLFTLEDKRYLNMVMNQPHKPDLAVLGGEPLCPQNYAGVKMVCEDIKKDFPDRKVWLWTGYELDELELDLSFIDIIITGRFIEELRDKDLKYFGSTNQQMFKRSDSKWILQTL